MKKLNNKDLAKILYSEGKLIERNYFEHYSIIECFGQRYRIENPEGKGVKITQLSNVSKP